MGTRDNAGFTIIEVVLFLAISGLMMALILGGWTTMINTQRYEDSVVSLQGFLQDQYNLVYNVENGRANNLTCNQASGVTTGATPRGQTNCLLLGRFLRVENGTNVEVKGIVGSELADDDTSNSDGEAILASSPRIVEQELRVPNDEFVVPWGAEIVNTDGNPLDYVIAIIRSPLADSGGSVHTYIRQVGDAANVTTLTNLIDPAFESNDVQMCLDAGAPLSGGTRAVIMQAYASSQTSILTRGEGDVSC